jgi:hypothetical protein
MPMIDAYADSTLFPKESPKALGLNLTNAVLRAEGVTFTESLTRENAAVVLVDHQFGLLPHHQCRRGEEDWRPYGSLLVRLTRRASSLLVKLVRQWAGVVPSHVQKAETAAPAIDGLPPT